MAAQTRPNLLIFMTDQQRADTIPPWSRAITPNLDRFCAEGLTFSRAYCCSPHCCPSRASFFSGLYPSQHGVWNNVDVGNTLSQGLFEDVRLWSSDLREAGYDLFFSGKWHVDRRRPPADFGWSVGSSEKARAAQETLREKSLNLAETSRDPNRPHTREWLPYLTGARHPQRTVRGPGEILRPGYPPYIHYGIKEPPVYDEPVLAEALAAIGARRQGTSDRPWCQYIGTIGPHDPYFVPQRFLDWYDPAAIELPSSYSDRMTDKPGLYRRTRQRFDQLSDAEQREGIRHYLAYCSYEDDLFGQVLRALEASGEAENTLVLYLSDHGDYVADHGLWCKGLPCFESAYHIPCVMRWPVGIKNPGRTVDAFVSITDFAPTFLELAAVKPRRLAGSSLVPFIDAQSDIPWRDAVFTQSNGNELYGIQRSVMTRSWKYVYNGFDFDELYDLEADPGETVNRIDDPACSGIIRQLSRRLWQFAQATDDVCINPYIMVALAPYGPSEAFRSD